MLCNTLKVKNINTDFLKTKVIKRKLQNLHIMVKSEIEFNKVHFLDEHVFGAHILISAMNSSGHVIFIG